jgi:hypothetical protein
MGSSLPASEFELRTRSAISMRAETNPGPFSWRYVRIFNVLEVAAKVHLRKRSYELGTIKASFPNINSKASMSCSVFD